MSLMMVRSSEVFPNYRTLHSPLSFVEGKIYQRKCKFDVKQQKNEVMFTEVNPKYTK